MKKALLLSTNYWDSPLQVGTHHIARNLALKDWEICFISHPFSPFHFIFNFGKELMDKVWLYKSGGRYFNEKRIWAYPPFSLLSPHNKPFFKSKWIAENWYKLSFPDVIKKVKHAGFADVDLIYFDNVFHSFWLDNIKYKKSIFRICDNFQGYKGYSAGDIEDKLAREVDIVLYTAKRLKEYVEKKSPKKTVYFPNAVSFDHFANPSKQFPKYLKGIKKPIVIFVGQVNERFDFELVNCAADNLPNVSFIIIGVFTVSKRKLADLPNIYTPGSVSFYDVPDYLHNSDVGIIPYNVKKYSDLVNSVNPLKLYEYMACGLPVVASKWDELLSMNSPAILCSDSDEFVKGIKRALESGKDKNVYIEFARRRDWKDQTNFIIDLIEEGVK